VPKDRQCWCGSETINTEETDFVVEGIPCCSTECYQTALQGQLSFQDEPTQLSVDDFMRRNGGV